MFSRNRITAGLAAVTVAFALGACDDSSPSSPSSPSDVSSPTTVEPQFANDSRQIGLVNVSTGDVELLNNVNLAVAANVIANVCNVSIPVAVLAQQVFVDGSETFCTGATNPITIEQSGGNQPSETGGGNNSRQAGLINVSLGDVQILNDVNAAIVANVLVNACDLTVALAIAAVQGVGDVSETVCTTEAGDIEIIQA
jgi:hypothetical protein